MKKVKTLTNSTLKSSMKKGGCGECQTSCQSACKTSCTVGNQSCENANRAGDDNKQVTPTILGIVGVLYVIIEILTGLVRIT